MNKRDSSKKYKKSSKEDLNIRDVAYDNTINSRFVLGMVIFGLAMFLVTIMFSLNYYTQMNKEDYRIMEYKKDDNRITIMNSGSINEIINPSIFDNKGKYVKNSYASIKLETSENEKNDIIIKFNVLYDIVKNTFNKNVIATNDGEVLVRFAYSYDNKEWTSINNVIRINESTLNPLMGSFYDIGGVISKLKVASEFELKVKPKESNIMYWKSETLFQNKNNKELSGEFEANFEIEYLD